MKQIYFGNQVIAMFFVCLYALVLNSGYQQLLTTLEIKMFTTISEEMYNAN